MLDYITCQEAAKKWGVTTRRVQILCMDGKIDGAIKYATVWAIPKDTEKPMDGRHLRKDKNTSIKINI